MSGERDRLADAKSQCLAQYVSIAALVKDLRKVRDDHSNPNGWGLEDAERTIQEDALSVECRAGWYCPGGDIPDVRPVEYLILLCTGGPAVRIVGKLNDHCEPETASLEYQDWGTPWTEYQHGDERLRAERVLLDYARCFYFGEG